MAKPIPAAMLVPMDVFGPALPLRIELAYAAADNLLLGEAVYRPGAQLWLHVDLARVVVLAAKRLQAQALGVVLYDGLRSVEAQQKMLETGRVRQNPHWLEEPRLLSPPGAGGHPRAMAVDIALETVAGELLDMGTPFDYLAEDAGPEQNPAHRLHPRLSQAVRHNRSHLEETMHEAAAALKTPLLALPQEWWDFRLPADIYEAYTPLCDTALPPQMRMTDAPGRANAPADFPASHFEELGARLLDEIAGL